MNTLVLEDKNEEYRDERMYVLNLTRGKLKVITRDFQKTDYKYFVNTYKNLILLPFYKTNYFDTKNEAIEFVKQIEPFIPLINNHEFPLSTPEGESTWEHWLSWLNQQGFHSAISDYQNLPYAQFRDGGSFDIKDYYNHTSYENN